MKRTYPAIVTKTNDPEKRGRIKVVCVGIMGDEEEELPMWVEPAAAWGWFVVPEPGEQVEIEVTEESDDDEAFEQSSISDLDPRWKGSRVWMEDGIPEEFTERNYGKRRGFATPGGHVFLFDDTKGDRQISVTFKADGDQRSLWSFAKDGSFIVNTLSKHLISLDATNNTILIVDPQGNTLASGPDGIKLMDSDGNAVDLQAAAGLVQVLSASGITLSTKNVSIDAGEIALGGGASEKALLGDTFLDLFANHQHPSGMGPTGAPLAGSGGSVALWSSALSQKVTLE